MDKAAFSLEKYVFDQVTLNLGNVKSKTSFVVDFDPSGIFKQEGSIYKLKFTFKAWEEDTPQDIVVDVRCIADFKFEGITSIEEIPGFFYPNSIAILFPYVRAFVSTLTLQANVKPILLPTLNLTSLQETLRENTIVE